MSNLVIEDGSLVSGADSYITVAECRAYALKRGVTLSADDDLLDVSIIQAMDFAEGFRDRYQGIKVAGTQSLQHPREGMSVDGYLVENTTIHQTLKDGVCQLTMDVVSLGTDLRPTLTDGRAVIREKVDVLETEYAEGQSGTSVNAVLQKAMDLLEPLFESALGAGALPVSRS